MRELSTNLREDLYVASVLLLPVAACGALLAVIGIWGQW